MISAQYNYFFLKYTCIIFIQFFLSLMDQQLSGSVMQPFQPEIKKHLQTASYVSNFSRKLQQQKKTIILLHDKQLKDSQTKVKLIAYFLMGFSYSQLSDKGLKFEFDDKSAKQLYFPIYNVKVGVLENDKNLRVIFFQSSSKEFPTGEIAFSISIIEKMISQSPKIYLVTDEYDENRQNLNGLIKQFNINTNKEDLNQIYFGDSQDIQNPNDLMLSKKKGEYKLPSNYDIFAKKNEKDLNIKSLLKCLQEKKHSYQELANLVTYRTEIQALGLNLISAITFMMNCAVNNKQSQIKNQLKEVLSELEVLLLTDQNENMELDDQVKYHPKLAYKYLVLDIIEFINTNQKKIQNLGAQKPQAMISWLKNFFAGLIQKIRVLPVVDQKNLMLFNQLGLFFTLQLEMLSKISYQYLSPQIQIFLRELYIRGGQIKERVQDNTVKIKLFGLIVDIPIEQKMGLKYYADFDKLIDNCSKDLQLKNLPNKQALISKKNNLKQRLPLTKLKAALDSEGLNKDEIKLQIQSIAEFYNTISKNLKLKKNLDWKQLINLFNKGGHILKKNGFPQLAIQFFKKIRFENQIQSCVKDIILKNGLRQEGKSELYMQICKYFESNDRFEKARQYAQKAYESYPNNINYLKKQRQLTKRMHNCHVDKTFLASVGSFNADNLDNFYNYELKQTLNKELQEASRKFQELQSTFDLSIQNFNFNFESMEI